MDQQLTITLPSIDLSVIDEVKVFHPQALERVKRGKLALSQIQTITDDATDKIANDLLVKVRATLEGGKTATGEKTPGIIDQRKEITGKFDTLKALLMAPEKELQLEADRVKKLRDGWANEKLRKQQEAEDAIRKQKEATDEEIRIKAQLRENINNAVFAALNGLGDTIKTHVGQMTLENWDEMEKKFKMTPKLKQDVYDNSFMVGHNGDLVSEARYAELVAEVKAEETYEKYSSIYVQNALSQVKMWADSLPAKKEDLIRIAELEKTNAMSAAAERIRLANKEDADNKKKQEELSKQKEQLDQLSKTKENDEKTLSDFTAQVAQQEVSAGTTAGGKRTKRVAVINCPDHEIVKVLSKVLFACYSSPKFKGHLKRTKEGLLLQPDANGVPQYADWAQELLDFIAQNTDAVIEGIEFKTVASTIQKA